LTTSRNACDRIRARARRHRACLGDRHRDARIRPPLDRPITNRHQRRNPTTLTVARNEYKCVAEIELDLEDIPLVSANAGDLNQVFLNLIVNAAHAIESRSDDPPNRATIAISTRTDRRNVLITMSDSGCGIPADIADRVFDPFFTTKPVGRGTGQGLAIAYAIIVERYHGTISFEPRPGGGTTFHVMLPLDEPRAQHAQLDQAA
jgi:signal transduction histidine kinase